jgi:hypothetical protein
MSGNTLLLEFTGRKSGRALSTPISYHLADGTAHCFTTKAFGWWRNLTNGQTVSLVVRGERFSSTPVVELTDHAEMAVQLDAFLRAVPRDASHAGVALGADGTPDADDVRRAVQDMVYLQFPLEEKPS